MKMTKRLFAVFMVLVMVSGAVFAAGKTENPLVDNTYAYNGFDAIARFYFKTDKEVFVSTQEHDEEVDANWCYYKLNSDNLVGIIYDENGNEILSFSYSNTGSAIVVNDMILLTKL